MSDVGFDETVRAVMKFEATIIDALGSFAQPSGNGREG